MSLWFHSQMLAVALGSVWARLRHMLRSVVCEMTDALEEILKRVVGSGHMMASSREAC